MTQAAIEQKLKSEMDAVAQQIKLNAAIWSDCHNKGYKLICEMTNIQGKFIDSQNLLMSLTAPRRIASERVRSRRLKVSRKEQYIKLLKLLTRLSLANDRTCMARKKVLKWADIPEWRMTVLYDTWQLVDIFNFVDDLLEMYVSEFEIKQKAVEDLMQLTNERDLNLFKRIWRKPKYALTEAYHTLIYEFDTETTEPTDEFFIV